MFTCYSGGRKTLRQVHNQTQIVHKENNFKTKTYIFNKTCSSPNPKTDRKKIIVVEYRYRH